MAQAQVVERVAAPAEPGAVDPYGLAGRAYNMLRAIGWEEEVAADVIDDVLAKGRTLEDKHGAMVGWLYSKFSPAQLRMVGK